ncbi:MAG: hypothetical protein EAZ14_08240 [Runella slithyformis]|jgi:hypothetical protein|nr:MAG: hypothetical protein EAZ46_02460 [Runella sp.]TAG19836.1 MAG: hypothetical protein EAZ38_11615 [Cytophagales bacterium]TAG39083.1 MAG: hypothetical protein EAZ32_10795 [Cytophagia bacterium]TAG62204.1 MAG: hypothetical protein EAZ26_12555 [Runella slithyformis]TAG80730.1 MAG: hypothetical protein EAZ22_08765 [Cytophagales bacterium]
MTLQQKEIDYLEEQIPLLAELAVSQAFWQSLASGHSVLVADNGELVEVMPDGTKHFVKKIAKRQIIKQKYFTISKV